MTHLIGFEIFLRIEIFSTGDKVCQRSIIIQQHEQLADAHEDPFMDQSGNGSLELPLA